MRTRTVNPSLTLGDCEQYCLPGFNLQVARVGRGPLFQEGCKPVFSGHETFPLRYGWLKKAYEAVRDQSVDSSGKPIFQSDEAIGRFGVGKNMVGSIRHWAVSSGIVEGDETSPSSLRPTWVGDRLFGRGGLDPYLEHPASLWFLHWLMCSGERQPIKATWFWVFNHYPHANFRRDDLADGIMKLADERKWQRVARTTVQRDVECFVRMYEARTVGAQGAVEENLESPFAELGLVRGHKGSFHLARGPQPSLPQGVFAVALDDFWRRQGSTRTLAFETIAHEPGSPGRVFLLDEADLADRLLALEETTAGAFRWSETAGLKQVLREGPLAESARQRLLGAAYGFGKRKEAVQ